MKVTNNTDMHKQPAKIKIKPGNLLIIKCAHDSSKKTSQKQNLTFYSVPVNRNRS